MKKQLNIKKTQQIFKSERHVFTKEVNNITSSVNYDKRIQSIDSIETYPYKTSKHAVPKKGKTKCNNIIKLCK